MRATSVIDRVYALGINLTNSSGIAWREEVRLLMEASTIWLLATLSLFIVALPLLVWQRRQVRLVCRVFEAGKTKDDKYQIVTLKIANTSLNSLKADYFEGLFNINFGDAVIVNFTSPVKLGDTELCVKSSHHELSLLPFTLAKKEFIKIAVELENYKGRKPRIAAYAHRLSSIHVLSEDEEVPRPSIGQSLGLSLGSFMSFGCVLVGILIAGGRGGILSLIIGALSVGVGSMLQVFLADVEQPLERWMFRTLFTHLVINFYIYFVLFGLVKYYPTSKFDPTGEYFSYVISTAMTLAFLTLLAVLTVVFVRGRKKKKRLLTQGTSSTLMTTKSSNSGTGFIAAAAQNIMGLSFTAGLLTLTITDVLSGGLSGGIGFILGFIVAYSALLTILLLAATRKKKLVDTDFEIKNNQSIASRTEPFRNFKT